MTIRRVKQYFNEYIYSNREDIFDPSKRAQIKLQLLDAFRKEVFEQITFRYGPDVLQKSRDELKDLGGINNILIQTTRKWKRLCMLCNDVGLVNWLRIEDLKDILEGEDAPDGSVGEPLPAEGTATEYDKNGKPIVERYPIQGDFDGDETLKVAEPIQVGQEFPAGYWLEAVQ